MIKIRKGTFETNSSSTHSMVIGLKSDFDKWKKGEVLYLGEAWGTIREGLPDFIPKEEFVKIFKENNKLKGFKGIFDESDLDILHDEGIWESIDSYCDIRYEYLECESADYITPAGEEVHILCHYGYDG